MAETLKDKLSVKDKWIRLIFMAIFACVVYWIALVIVWLVALFQFIYTLFVGKANKTLLPFSEALGNYIKEIIHYLTYNTEAKPFPFKPWPGTETKAAPAVKKPVAKKSPAKEPAANKTATEK